MSTETSRCCTGGWPQRPTQTERDEVFRRPLTYRQSEALGLLAPVASQTAVNAAWIEAGNASRFSLWEVLWNHVDRAMGQAAALLAALQAGERAWVDRLVPETPVEAVVGWDPASLNDAILMDHAPLMSLLLRAQVGSPNQTGAYPVRLAVKEGCKTVLPLLRPYVDLPLALQGVLKEPENYPAWQPWDHLPRVSAPNLAVLDRLVTWLPAAERASWLQEFPGALPQALATQRAETLAVDRASAVPTRFRPRA